MHRLKTRTKYRVSTLPFKRKWIHFRLKANTFSCSPWQCRENSQVLKSAEAGVRSTRNIDYYSLAIPNTETVEGNQRRAMFPEDHLLLIQVSGMCICSDSTARTTTMYISLGENCRHCVSSTHCSWNFSTIYLQLLAKLFPPEFERIKAEICIIKINIQKNVYSILFALQYAK